MADQVEFDARWVAGLLAAFAAPPVVLLAGDATGGLGAGPSMVVVMLPLLAVLVVLGRLALRVGASADEPELVDEGVARATGVTSEEYEELFD